MGRSGVRRQGDVEERVFALVRDNAYELLRFARRFSLSEDDAQDAYQRALEILVKQVRSGTPPESTLSWLRTVLRHEASQVRAERQRHVSREGQDVEQQRGEVVDDPAERVERFERLAHTAEALRGLKPQEVTALVLRAEGLTYKEICDRTEWTYTRCNRCITEGRRALRERLEEIESGAQCERWVPLLSMLADGEATARELAELRPHLRSCAACRATLRGFHEAPRQVRALVPVALLPVAAAAPAGAAGRQIETLVHWVLERAGVSAMRMQGAVEALSGTKVAAVAASTVAVAGGGAAIERAATAERERPPRPAAAQVATAAPSRSLAVAPASSTPLLQRGAAPRPAAQTGPALLPDRFTARAPGEPDSEFALEPATGGVPRSRPRAAATSGRTHDRAAARAGAPPATPPPTASTASTAPAPARAESRPSRSDDSPSPPTSEFGGP